jgi:hypothetical protein
VDLGTVSTAWGVAGIVSKVYWLLGGCAAVLLLATPAAEESRPSAALIRLLGWSDAPESQPRGVADWIQDRGDVVSLVAQSVVVLALLWSAAELFERPNALMDVRGPATAWLGVLVIAEGAGPGELRSFLIHVAISATLIAGLEFVIHLVRRQIGREASGWGAATTIGLLIVGICLMPLVPVVALAYAAGGRSRS